jgi:hypothetical protein
MGHYPTTGLAGPSPADLAWMTGSWAGQRGDDLIDEHWSPLVGGTMMGMFRWLRGEQVFFYEFTTLAVENGLVMLRIKHFYPKLVGWEEKDKSVEFMLVQLSGQEAVFLELNVPSPPWMIYRLEDEHTLVSYFEREGEAVSAAEQFIYTRQESMPGGA